MKSLIDSLDGHSLAVRNHGETRVYDGRGIIDLYRLVTGTDFLCGADVADKVVGKGAAALMILGGVKRVHALTVSRQALALFADSTATVSYDTAVDAIINRSGTGPCPVESLCADCSTAEQCLPLITTFVEKLESN